MISDYSFGIIPIQCTENGIWEVFLVQHKRGYWSLPKGHQEGLENPLETAKRELSEETGLMVEKVLLDQPLFEHYSFTREGKIINKTVGYFLALVSGEIHIQQEELKSGRWVHLFVAEDEMTYPEGKELIRKACALVRSQSEST